MSMDKAYNILVTEEYEKWKNDQRYKEQLQIELRLSKIEIDSHFGSKNYVGTQKAPIWELK